ncbi:MAG: CCA tRNA nucleotidyltransferase [Erythrobacter sp.]
MSVLPQAGWMQREGLAELVVALGADHMRWVGGCVRDTLLALDVHDVDCATIHLPNEVIRRCKDAGIKVVPTGIDHGTVTAVFKGGPVEITTLRQDVATDGRRATVAFASDWKDDAARRDFTINALYAHPETSEIDDYFGGLDDLDARTVRFIGDARQRIKEDHLRILRYFRFQARFGAEWDDEAVTACEELSATLKGLSRERVAMELLAICALPDPYAAFERMRELGVLAVILPETTPAQMTALQGLIAAEAAQGFAPDPIRRLAALLPPLAPVAETVAVRLRLSRAQRARLMTAAERMGEDAENPQALAYKYKNESAIDRLLMAGADAQLLKGWEAPRFPLKGGAIVARGVGAGPEVARIMREIEARWVSEGFPDEARVLQMLDDALS